MKGLILLLMFSSQLLFSQNNIAIFHANKGTVSASSTVGKAVAIAPFELINGMALVKASIDGVLGNFILDTGSPGLVINSTNQSKANYFEATSVGGPVAIGETKVDHFKWGIIEKENLTGFTIDISHLEKATGRKLTGLIGHEILQQYEVYFDYPSGLVKIYDAASANEFRKESPSFVIPFQMVGHIPSLEVQIGSKRVILGIDSGAEVNLLDRSFYKKIDKQFLKNKTKERVIGLDKTEYEVVAADLDGSEMSDHKMPTMKFLFMNLDGLTGQFDSQFDGLLGFPFFHQHAVSINYQEMKIYFWE